MATRDDAQAMRNAKLDALHQRLAGAVKRLVAGEDWRRALEFSARFRSRSFNNTMLIFAQHQAAWEVGRVPDPVPTFVAGFRQWEQLDRHVAKGQKGYAILAPVTGRFASSTPQDAASWRRLNLREKPKPGEVVRSRMVGAKPAYVFDVSQTSGVEVPTPPRPVLLEGEAPAGLREGLISQVEAAGYRFLSVPHEGMIHGANGMTDYTARTVAVRTNMDDAAQVKTLAHELAHVLLHGPADEDATKHRGIAEVEAESVALMVGAAHGMDTSLYTIPYVSGWAATVAGKEPVAVVQATAERVRKAAVGILGQLDTVQIGDGTPPGLTREVPAEAASAIDSRTARAAAAVAELRRVERRPVIAARSL